VKVLPGQDGGGNPVERLLTRLPPWPFVVVGSCGGNVAEMKRAFRSVIVASFVVGAEKLEKKKV
ncbi:unnamed protein product, partial [Allacma fusca]